MRVIFVPVADRPECVSALNTAFSIGHSVGASVIGCHIRPHGESPVTLLSTINTAAMYNDEAEWRLFAKPDNGGKAKTAARALFSRLAESHGYELIRAPRASPGAVWMEKAGSPGRIISIMGPISDLLVVSRPASKSGKLARMFLSAALLKSSRPVLVLPQKKQTTLAKHISIAWNQSNEAARAVTAAMPLLLRAESVSILRSGPENRAGPMTVHLASYLRYWGVKTKRYAGKGRDEHLEIMDLYKQTGSDLLVMGAYTRSRMSRRIFGGMTDYVLGQANIPALLHM
jgi:nucleotide-binding universal stress UspA family protein